MLLKLITNMIMGDYIEFTSLSEDCWSTKSAIMYLY